MGYYVTNKTLPVCSYYSLVVNMLTIVLISPSADTIVPATTGIMLINMANGAVSVYMQRNILSSTKTKCCYCAQSEEKTIYIYITSSTFCIEKRLVLLS